MARRDLDPDEWDADERDTEEYRPRRRAEPQHKSAGAKVLSATSRAARWSGSRARASFERQVGGAARAQVIWMFALVLALNGAATAAVGAMSPQLESQMHIGTTEIGLLSSVTLLAGAIATIPMGMLVDKVRRIPMLAISVALWSLASVVSGFTSSYGTLLVVRALLGVVVASAGPAIASLTGDYFPAKERGRIYAYILGGEIAGNALGFIVAGTLAGPLGWRAAFIVLGLPGFLLARELHRTIPEPLRGGQSHLEPGVEDLVEAAAAARSKSRADIFGDDEPFAEPPEDLARDAARQLGIEPDPRLVLKEDPRKMTLMSSVRYVLSIPTNLLMIISSTLGYFFYAGLLSFALLFVRGHFHIGQAEAMLVLAALVIGALVGTLVAGWVGDALLKRGHINARVWIPAICYLAATACLLPGFIMTDLGTAVWLYILGAAFLCGANPPLDAARLDIMPPGLWGRAESVRTLIRSLGQALAPTLFGGLASLVAGFYPQQAPIGTHPHTITSATAHGLEITFLVLLITLALSGLSLLQARATYPQDVATASAAEVPKPGVRLRAADATE